MPQRATVPSVAENLCALAKDFKSGDPVTSTAIRREFKLRSKNDVVRSVVYLMEVIGSRDQQFKALQDENKDLKELLKVNNIKLDEEENGTAQTNPDETIGERKQDQTNQVTATPAASS